MGHTKIVNRVYTIHTKLQFRFFFYNLFFFNCPIHAIFLGQARI